MKPVLIASPIHRSGFTLIEIIVVVSIMLLMMGGGIATYTAFRSGKIAQRQARLVSDLLDEARHSAISGEKPTDCGANSLTGYSVALNPDNAVMTAVCAGGTPPSKTRQLTDATISSNVATITFKVLTGGAVDAVVDVCADSHLFRITVTSAGNVTEPAEVAGGC